MPTQQKMDTVAELTEIFRDSSFVMTTEYLGMTVKALQDFRRVLRKAGGGFKIAKGSLAKMAADNSGREDLKQFVLGPVGFFTVSADADPSAAVKALLDYAARNRIEKILRVKGGVLGSKPLTAADIVVLSKLPPQDELRARFIGLLNAPASRLVGLFQSPSRGLVTLVNAYKEKMESAA